MKITLRRSNNDAEFPAWWAYRQGETEPVAEVRTAPRIGYYHKYLIYLPSVRGLVDAGHTLAECRRRIIGWFEEDE